MSAIGSIPRVLADQYKDDYEEHVENEGTPTEMKYYTRRGGGRRYNSIEDYQVACAKWAVERNLCAQYAEYVIACHDLEISTAIVYKLFGDMDESMEFTFNQLTKAEDQLGKERERAIQECFG